MKVLILANINSTHTKKWCLGLKEQGIGVILFSLNAIVDSDDWYLKLDYTYFPKSKPTKFDYLSIYFDLKKIIKDYKPDILHSHFATNYSFLGAISGFKNHAVTTWGSDVFVYPNKNFIYRALLKFNLSKAKIIISTSHAMAKELAKYTKKTVDVIPFGVDFSLFKTKEFIPLSKKDKIVLGCFKKTEPIYATDVLINAVQLVKNTFPEKTIELWIVGDGKKLNEYKQLSKSLGLEKNILFLGWKNPNDVPSILSQIDISVYLSRSESFGVSLIESMACKIPVVASKAQGFLEVMENENNGMLVDIENVVASSNAIGEIILNDNLNKKITDHAYLHVMKKYNIIENVKVQIELYQKMLK